MRHPLVHSPDETVERPLRRRLRDVWSGTEEPEAELEVLRLRVQGRIEHAVEQELLHEDGDVSVAVLPTFPRVATVDRGGGASRFSLDSAADALASRLVGDLVVLGDASRDRGDTFAFVVDHVRVDVP